MSIVHILLFYNVVLVRFLVCPLNTLTTEPMNFLVLGSYICVPLRFGLFVYALLPLLEYKALDARDTALVPVILLK